MPLLLPLLLSTRSQSFSTQCVSRGRISWLPSLEVGSVLSDLPAGLPKRFALVAAAYDQPLEARAQAILDDQVVDAAVQLASLTEEFASEIAEQLLASMDAVELLCTMLRMGTDDGRGAAATLLCEVASRNAAAKISFVEHSLLVPTWCRADPTSFAKLCATQCFGRCSETCAAWTYCNSCRGTTAGSVQPSCCARSPRVIPTRRSNP